MAPCSCKQLSASMKPDWVGIRVKANQAGGVRAGVRVTVRAAARSLTPPLALSRALTRTPPLHLACAVDRRDALAEGGLVDVRVRVRVRVGV